MDLAQPFVARTRACHLSNWTWGPRWEPFIHLSFLSPTTLVCTTSVVTPRSHQLHFEGFPSQARRILTVRRTPDDGSGDPPLNPDSSVPCGSRGCCTPQDQALYTYTTTPTPYHPSENTASIAGERYRDPRKGTYRFRPPGEGVSSRFRTPVHQHSTTTRWMNTQMPILRR